MGFVLSAVLLAAKAPARHRGPDVDWPLLIGVATLLVLVIIGIFCDRAMRRRLRERRGARALGAIVWQTPRLLPNGSTLYVLKVKFRTARGGSYSFRLPSQVPQGIGQRVVVHYLPNWPYVAEIERWSVPDDVKKIDDLPAGEPAPVPFPRDFGIPPPE